MLLWIKLAFMLGWEAIYGGVHTTIRVDKDWGLKQIEADSFQSELSVHTTECNLD